MKDQWPYRRAVTWQEDACPVRRGRAPAGLAAVNTTVVSLVAQHGWAKRAKAQRKVAYGVDRACAHRAGQPR